MVPKSLPTPTNGRTAETRSLGRSIMGRGFTEPRYRLEWVGRIRSSSLGPVAPWELLIIRVLPAYPHVGYASPQYCLEGPAVCPVAVCTNLAEEFDSRLGYGRFSILQPLAPVRWSSVTRRPALSLDSYFLHISWNVFEEQTFLLEKLHKLV
ncbi:hypothetical protein EVAR_99048_1 [Eumeta japonica]|uniref:Uncharacterized protein n=1 Tax=Eumeta variegata TaxID=151549 RepID=A0A4C1Y0P9_EUMVA|nr:hypothetical protein EVAR_99048_1 [Eumeta japonica]